MDLRLAACVLSRQPRRRARGAGRRLPDCRTTFVLGDLEDALVVFPPDGRGRRQRRGRRCRRHDRCVSIRRHHGVLACRLGRRTRLQLGLPAERLMEGRLMMLQRGGVGIAGGRNPRLRRWTSSRHRRDVRGVPSRQSWPGRCRLHRRGVWRRLPAGWSDGQRILLVPAGAGHRGGDAAKAREEWTGRQGSGPGKERRHGGVTRRRLQGAQGLRVEP